jgi:hypothetical protein
MNKSNRSGADIDAVGLSSDDLRESDIMLFRKDSNVWSHKGTLYFSTVIELHQWQYCTATTGRKREIATTLLAHLRETKRRLLQQQKSKRTWNEVIDDKLALQKIKDALNNGRVERDKLLKNKLAKAIATKTTATARIEVPSLLVSELIKSTLVTGLNFAEAFHHIEDDNSCFYATIELPCRHTDKAKLNVETQKAIDVDENMDISCADLNFKSITTDKSSELHCIELASASIHSGQEISENKQSTKRKLATSPAQLECLTIIPDDDEEQIKYFSQQIDTGNLKRKETVKKVEHELSWDNPMAMSGNDDITDVLTTRLETDRQSKRSIQQFPSDISVVRILLRVFPILCRLFHR